MGTPRIETGEAGVVHSQTGWTAGALVYELFCPFASTTRTVTFGGAQWA